jgi:hypothetical protein
MKDQKAQATPDPGSYDAPRVERVLTPAELEHEILYAGVPTGQDSETPVP